MEMDFSDATSAYSMWIVRRGEKPERLSKRRSADLEARVRNQKEEITRLLALQDPAIKSDLEKLLPIVRRVVAWREEARAALKFGEPEDIAREIQVGANIGYDADQALAECRSLSNE